MIARYLDHAKLGAGWLVMFDLRKEPSWSDKLYVHEARKIHLVRNHTPSLEQKTATDAIRHIGGFSH